MWITVVTFGKIGNGAASSGRTAEPSASDYVSIPSGDGLSLYSPSLVKGESYVKDGEAFSDYFVSSIECSPILLTDIFDVTSS